MFDLRVKKLFFDAKRVKNAVDRARREALARIGSFVKTTARQSIKRAPYKARKPRGLPRVDHRRKSSEPGHPPYSQTGILKNFIFFNYDERTDSVVIGPAKVLRRNAPDTPRTLEVGGTARISRLRHRRGRLKREKRKVNIAPRPYMGPAMAANLDKVPSVWANSVKGP